jgi:uncharacterized damage-inducible protein DinB
MTESREGEQSVPETDLAKQLAAEFEELLGESMRKIRHCVVQLDDEQIWRRPAEGQNSIANLLLHLAGNLQQWCVVGITESDDRRERSAEFAAAGGLASDELMRRLEGVVTGALDVIRGLEPSSLSEVRTIQGYDVSVLKALCHTIPHFVGHTHQIILLTRLILGDAYRFEWTPGSDQTHVPV